MGILFAALVGLSWVISSAAHAQFKLPWQLSAAPKPAANTASVTPHPAVARIIVPESTGDRQVTSNGSGSLIDVQGDYGLVITNWHVVRDAVGEVTVQFPDGFRSPATIVKTDKDWDLAALSIRRPAGVTPINLAGAAAQPGEPLAIAGYGSGDYRMAVGKMTQYLSPGERFPYEMMEVSVEARQGDSGGPIFNQRGELAGVLFGAGQGYTSGSYCGRVSSFLIGVLPANRLEGGAAPAADPATNSNPTASGGGWAARTNSGANLTPPAVPQKPAEPFADDAKDRLAANGRGTASGVQPVPIQTMALHPKVSAPKSSPYDVTAPAQDNKNAVPLSPLSPSAGPDPEAKLNTVVAKPIQADEPAATEKMVAVDEQSAEEGDKAVLYPYAPSAEEANAGSAAEDAVPKVPPYLAGAEASEGIAGSARAGVAPRIASNSLKKPVDLGNGEGGVGSDDTEPVKTSLSPRGGAGRDPDKAVNGDSTEEVLGALWRKIGGTSTFDQSKTILAMIGIFALLVKWYRWNSSSDHSHEDD